MAIESSADDNLNVNVVTAFVFRSVKSIERGRRKYFSPKVVKTFSKTSPCFYVSALKVFGKRKKTMEKG